MIRVFIKCSAILFLFGLIGCGPTEQERKVLEDAKLDSVATAVKKATEDSIELILLVAELKNKRNTTEDAILLIKYLIEDINEKRSIAQVELEKSKSFQFGRTPSEKEAQIRSHLDDINKLDNRLKSTEAGLKIFKRALFEMDDTVPNKINTVSEFKDYLKKLEERISRAEKEVLIDIESSYMNGFSYFKLMNDKSFLQMVSDFKLGKRPPID